MQIGNLLEEASLEPREDSAFAHMVGGPGNLEALTAFLEKREPDFRALRSAT